VDRVKELNVVFKALKSQLATAEGSAAAAIARELRILSAALEQLESPEKESKVDEVARRRESGAGVARPPARRRKSG
jgi:hypothetical protein